MPKVLFSIMNLFFLMLPSPSFAETLENRIGYYGRIKDAKDQIKKNYIYKQISEIKTTGEGDRDTSGKVIDQKNNVIMTEKAQIVRGQVIYQKIEQFQDQVVYELKQNKDVVLMTETSMKDSSKKSEYKIDGKVFFVTGPSLELFFKSKIENIQSGIKVVFNFAVFEILKLVEFKVQSTDFEMSTASSEQKNLVALKMKIKNVFLSAFVDSLYLELNKNTGHLVNYRGRTPLKIEEKGKLVPFDADIYYEFQ